MKAGAVEFFTKPFHDQDLLDAIEVALEKDRARLADQKLIAELRERFDTLTARERQVPSRAAIVRELLKRGLAAEGFEVTSSRTKLQSFEYSGRAPATAASAAARSSKGHSVGDIRLGRGLGYCAPRAQDPERLNVSREPSLLSSRSR